MSSSSKTPHIGLNQWESGDRATRSEFNENNSILDSAIYEIRKAFEGAKSKSHTFPLPASSWTGDGPYTQTVQIDGITADTNAIVDTAMDSTEEQEDAYAAAQIKPESQGNGSITFIARGDKPEIDIPMGVIIVG